MTRLAKSLLATLLLVVIFAFTERPISNITGVYGVAADDPSHIQLVLNADNSFTYQDFSIPDHKIEVAGKWELKNNTIILNSSDTSLKFHSKWKISPDGQVAKSRKGMIFYSLRKK